MTQKRSFVRSSMVAGGSLLFVACFASLVLVGCPSGAVGDPCIPEDEYLENFAGFKVSEENVESRSFQCQTRICLVNHFQGRVSCPQGQDAPQDCPNGDGDCTNPGEKCVFAGVLLKDCDPTVCGTEGADPNNCNGDGGRNNACGGRVCDSEGKYCRCEQATDCPTGYNCCVGAGCEGHLNLCTTQACSKPDDPTRCYVPGTDTPVATAVCSQCAKESLRDAEDAVYCSCRCAPPDDNPSPADDNYNFCDCPEGYTCEEIRKNVGLGDAQLAGKYCIKQDTKFIDPARSPCGAVQGYWGTQCDGTPTVGVP